MSESGGEQRQEQWRPRHNPWAVALTVTMATFMEVLDTSIANVSLPHIAGSLSAGQDESTWVLTSYLVANAVVLPISAWLSDRFGRKRFYMTCVALFTVSSFLCGMASSLGMLVFFRILQGAGGGGLGPSEQAILADTFPPQKRGMAFAVYGMAVVLAPAIGPTLGGYITDNFSWHWIFFINVPVGALSLFLSSRMVEDPPHVVAAKQRSQGTGIDGWGLGLIAVGLGSLQVVLDKGEREDWFQSPFIRVVALAAAAALIAFVFVELHHKRPVLELRMLKKPNFAVANFLMLCLGAALFGSTVLIPQFLQLLMHYTAQQSGEALSAGGIVVMCLMPVVGVLVSRVDARYLITFGFIVSALALFHMTTINLQIDFRTAMMYRVFQSMGLAFLFVPINTISYFGTKPEQSNQVSAMVNLMRNLGGSIGISAITTLIARRSQTHQTALAANVSSTNLALQRMVTGLSRQLATAGASSADAIHGAYGRVYGLVQQQAALLAYIDAIRIMAIVCVICIPISFIARRNKPGQAAMGH
jgi:DHA2 family multidrug resistance protein